jgi:hypothetical protein
MSLKARISKLERDGGEPSAQTFLASRRGFAFMIGSLTYEELTETERVQLAAEQQQHERDHDPPDSIERRLARLIAEARDEPDPYGTGRLSEAERRAWDWKDYHEKERQRLAEQAQEEDRPQYGLRELPASETMSVGKRKDEREQLR